jgi:hypothetical protein
MKLKLKGWGGSLEIIGKVKNMGKGGGGGIEKL